MSRRATTGVVLVVCAIALAILGALAMKTAPAKPVTHDMYVTYYGWYDNSPPGGGIAYPRLHKLAGGTGTYRDPITVGTSAAELKPGTRLYYPTLKRYFIVEDECTECEDDWSKQGPNGGPKLWHIDAWVGGQGNEMASIECEYALTQTDDNGRPKLTPVIVHPSAKLPVSPTPIVDPKTGACYGGATASSTIGAYKNAATGQCLTAPETSPGVVTTAPCDGDARQQLKFLASFFTAEGGCLAGQGNSTSTGTPLVFATCNGGPAEQWAFDPDGSINGVQASEQCVEATATGVRLAACNHAAAQQWHFTSSSS